MEPGASSKKTPPNWLDLPRDLTIQIFLKIGVIDLLFYAQSVCSSWRAIARDPRLYRVLDLRDARAWKHFADDFERSNYDSFLKLATEAIDRSCGQAIEFSIGGPDYGFKYKILCQLKYKTPGLKCLRLSSCSIVDDNFMIEVILKLPLLEEVEFCNCYFSREVIKVLGRSCPKLKSFRLNDNTGQFLPYNDAELFNSETFVIVGNMNPSLRSLHLFGETMNNTGLEAILDRFSQLEYLDLRQCFNLDLNGDLLKRCRAIKRFRLPNDSIKDYEYEFDKVLSTEDDYDYNNGDFDKDDSDCNDGDNTGLIGLNDVQDNTGVSEAAYAANFCNESIRLSQLAAKTLEGRKLYVDVLRTTRVALQKIEDSMHVVDYEGPLEDTNTSLPTMLLDPRVSQTKGRNKKGKTIDPSQRIKSGMELSQDQRKSTRKCHFCGVVGVRHDKRTCPLNPARQVRKGIHGVEEDIEGLDSDN